MNREEQEQLVREFEQSMAEITQEIKNYPEFIQRTQKLHQFILGRLLVSIPSPILNAFITASDYHEEKLATDLILKVKIQTRVELSNWWARTILETPIPENDYFSIQIDKSDPKFLIITVSLKPHPDNIKSAPTTVIAP